jgi:hypothetical protein
MGYFSDFQVNAQRKQSPNVRKVAQSGHTGCHGVAILLLNGTFFYLQKWPPLSQPENFDRVTVIENDSANILKKKLQKNIKVAEQHLV